MDLDEWVYLPDDGFLDFQEVSEEKRIFSSKRYSSSDNSKSVFNMNYFINPSPNSRSKVIHETPPPPPQPPTPPASPAGINSRLVPAPIQLELPPSFGKASSLSQEEQEEEKQVIKVSQVDQDTQLSQVYFKKTWENEFADMKILDSQKSPTCRSPEFMNQQTDKFQFDDNLGQEITSPRMKVVDKNSLLESSEEINSNNNNNNDNNNIWKRSFTGIGAICSFGFAAATICIIFFGAQQRNKQYQHNQNRFQIYTDDNKRIKQAVQDATKLNEALSAVRGVPLPRAHVTYGGYYNGL